MIDVLIVILVLSSLFVVGQYTLMRKEKRLRSERNGVSLEDFLAAESLQGVPESVSDAIFSEFLELFGYPPLAEDRLYEEHGLAGSDIDDLILRLSDHLQITWDFSAPIEANIHTVADLAHFLSRALEN